MNSAEVRIPPVAEDAKAVNGNRWLVNSGRKRVNGAGATGHR